MHLKLVGKIISWLSLCQVSLWSMFLYLHYSIMKLWELGPKSKPKLGGILSCSHHPAKQFTVAIVHLILLIWGPHKCISWKIREKSNKEAFLGDQSIQVSLTVLCSCLQAEMRILKSSNCNFVIVLHGTTILRTSVSLVFLGRLIHIRKTRTVSLGKSQLSHYLFKPYYFYL